jgi:hypothetical protein
VYQFSPEFGEAVEYSISDVLDSLPILGDHVGFEKAVKDVIEWVSFDVDTKPQLFETNIRVLGGICFAFHNVVVSLPLVNQGY